MTRTIANVNDGPRASDDFLEVAPAATIPLNVLANDDDADSEKLDVSVVETFPLGSATAATDQPGNGATLGAYQASNRMFIQRTAGSSPEIELPAPAGLEFTPGAVLGLSSLHRFSIAGDEAPVVLSWSTAPAL